MDVDFGVQKRLLQPELLQSHLAAALDFLLELAGLLRFYLHSCLGAAMLELDFSVEGPSFPKIITHQKNRMGQIYTPVTFRVSILFSVRVAEHIITIKIVFVYRFTVPTNGETAFGLHTVGRCIFIAG